MKKLGWAVNGFKVFRDIIRGVVVIFHFLHLVTFRLRLSKRLTNRIELLS